LNKLSNISDDFIVNKIYFLRDKKVMLDRDLAELYDVKAIRLREQVKRNIEKFPNHFMFQLTEKETNFMVSQNAIPSKKHLGGSLPFVFTEHGILQLSNVIKSKQATKISIKIIEIFVKMRSILLENKDILLKLERVEHKLNNHDEDINVIFKYLKQLLNPKNPPRKQIGFKTDE